MVTKNWFSRSRDPKSSEIGVIGGHNLKIFEPRHIIYQKEALGPVIKKKIFRGHLRSSDLKLAVFYCLERSERQKMRSINQLPRAKQEAKKSQVHKLK